MAYLIRFFFSMRSTLKLYHWQTTCHARHVAADGLLRAMEPLIDRFVEVYMGRYERPRFGQSEIQVRMFECTNEGAAHRLTRYAEFLRSELPKYVAPSSDADLLNIRDEMLAALNQASYLFTQS